MINCSQSEETFLLECVHFRTMLVIVLFDFDRFSRACIVLYSIVYLFVGKLEKDFKVTAFYYHQHSPHG